MKVHEVLVKDIRVIADKNYVDLSLLDLEDVLTKSVPSELTCSVRVLKQRNVILLPDAEVEVKVYIGKIIFFLQCY